MAILLIITEHLTEDKHEALGYVAWRFFVKESR